MIAGGRFLPCDDAFDTLLEVADLSIQHGFERIIKIVSIR
ncbi:hypothetical protein DT23_14710 [Thioclava indica]|uniref:Uncharacterized protein n=1 Tax=Thioclava indica TaxID=1353528 RepID=A0A074JWS8_9RHOB|nr:hypothetical protein DT23_14710 [Thioclava indica]